MEDRNRFNVATIGEVLYLLCPWRIAIKHASDAANAYKNGAREKRR